MAYYADRGVDVYLACATRGEAGRRRGSPPFVNQSELGEVRVRELHCSARILGVKGVFLLDLPDGGIAGFDAAEAASRLARVVRQTAPQVLIAFGPGGSLSPHPDHVAVSHLAHAAVRILTPEERPRRVFHYLSPWRNRPPEIVDGSPVVVDIGDYRLRRLQALKCHLTQVQQVPWLFGPEDEVAATFPAEDRFLLVEPTADGPLTDLFDGL
jgi:LmbE family N-acetylglucosaminyl deacetylase